VTVRGRGCGGRNQEAALAAALEIEGRPGLRVLCLATDGVDGTTPPGSPPHAGAVITGETVAAAARHGLNIASALESNDSYRACAALGLALQTGPTGTNVNDVWVGLARR